MNKFKVMKKHLVGDIKDFPVHVVQAMVNEQVNQGHKADPREFAASLWSGFCWNDTEQGHNFWRKVILEREFDLIPKPVKPKGHIHANLMAQYLKDAKVSETPWDKWECKAKNLETWMPLGAHPRWDIETAYRRKQKTKVETREQPTPHEIIKAMLGKGMDVWACVSDNSYDAARSHIGTYIQKVFELREGEKYPVKVVCSWAYAVPVDTKTMTEITELPK